MYKEKKKKSRRYIDAVCRLRLFVVKENITLSKMYNSERNTDGLTVEVLSSLKTDKSSGDREVMNTLS